MEPLYFVPVLSIIRGLLRSYFMHSYIFHKIRTAPEEQPVCKICTCFIYNQGLLRSYFTHSYIFHKIQTAPEERPVCKMC